MFPYRKAFWVSFITILCVALIIGCSANQTSNNEGNGGSQENQSSGSSTPNDTLVVAMSGGIDSYDPAFVAASLPSFTVLQNTFDQLTQYALIEETLPTGQTIKVTDTTNVIRMLAENYEVSSDGKTITFNIPPNLHYHNGNPINAKTLFEGFQRNFALNGVGAFLIQMTGVNNIDHISAPDESTLVFTLSEPNDIFLLNLTNPNTSALDPQEVIAHKRDNDPWARDWFRSNVGSGSGPFILESYEPGSKITLVRNDEYYADPAALKRVIILDIPETTQRVQMLRQGTIDVIENPPVSILDELAATPGINVYSVPSTRNNLMFFNTKMAPFDNKRVRQAVAYAVPYEQLLENVMRGYAQPGSSLVPKGMPTHDPTHWNYETNLEKASELLAEAGYPGGEGLPPIKLSVRAGTAEDEQVAVFIRSNLEQIGMDVEIETIPLANFNQLAQSSQLQVWFEFWQSWTNDPIYHLNWLAHSKSATNWTQFENATVDQIIDEYMLSSDESAREAASKELQRILADEVHMITLYQANVNVAMRDNVDGYVYTNDQILRFYYMNKK